MRKLNNTVHHEPEKGAYGDCHRICFAMLLGLEAEDVPHFFEEGDNGDRATQQQRVKNFLAKYDLVEVSFAYPVDQYEDILTAWACMSPGAAFILGGKSKTGCGHSVICMDGEIFHDPTGTGIIAPMDDGYYWVTVFAPTPGTHPRKQNEPV